MVGGEGGRRREEERKWRRRTIETEEERSREREVESSEKDTWYSVSINHHSLYHNTGIIDSLCRDDTDVPIA